MLTLRYKLITASRPENPDLDFINKMKRTWPLVDCAVPADNRGKVNLVDDVPAEIITT